jgi:hypothetical protein
VIKGTTCIIVLLVAATLFLKINRTEMREFREWFHGIVSAGVQELTFKGGRAAKANIILSAMLGIIFIFLCLTEIFKDVREFLGYANDNSYAKYVLFAALIVYFSVSLCFVYNLERYSKKIRNE